MHTKREPKKQIKIALSPGVATLAAEILIPPTNPVLYSGGIASNFEVQRKRGGSLPNGLC